MGAEHVVSDQLTVAVVVVLINGICSVVRCWIAYRLAVRQDAEATRRLELLAARVPAARRPAILRAYAELGRATPVSSGCRDQDHCGGDCGRGCRLQA
jgi:hypothetical protein